MNEVVEFLKSSSGQYLASIGKDGNPKVRPFQFMLEDGGKLYFCTGNNKTVYEEMQAHPFIELCASGDNFSWLRLSGKVMFTRDLAIKAKVQEASPFVKSIYQTPNNPVFEIFYLDDAVATITDFSGNPPRNFRF